MRIKKLVLWTMPLLALLIFVAGGCFVHGPPGSRSRHYRSKPHKKAQPRRHHRRPACSPSHYWDGHKCRHKGRGRGARKHDY